MSHIDGTLCPPGTHPVLGKYCNACKFISGLGACKLGRESIPCGGLRRPDGATVNFIEGAMPRLVLLRKVEGGYADIKPPEWAKSVRAYYGADPVSWSCWVPTITLGWPLAHAVDVLAYEFSSKTVEELNRE